MKIRSTTVICVRKDGKVALGADGQVTLDKTVMKHGAKKLRRLGDGSVLAGFAGATADAFTLFERFEGKLKDFNKNLARQRWSWRRTGARTGSCAGSRPCWWSRTRSA